MIKKINKLIDDMPILIKLILGIIMTGIITLCFFIIGVVHVSAASLDYDNTTNYIHKTNGTAEWIQFPRATEYNLNTLNTYDQINLQWTNYQSGVANGVARFEISSISLQALSCNQLYESIRIQENGNTIQVPIQRNSCIKEPSSNYILIEVGFVTSLLGTNSYFEVQFRNNIQLASKVRAYGVMTVTAIDPATNTDIQDQTNALINNNNTNTQIITNAVENSTTNIINQMQDNLNLCNNYNYTNEPVGKDNYYLNSVGVEVSNSSYKISDYVKLNKNKTYLLHNEVNMAPTSYCLYDESKTIISCTTLTDYDHNITNADYIRYTIPNYNNRKINLTGQYCQDRTQAEIDELQQLRSQLMHSGEWEEEDDEVKNGLLRNIISGIGNIFGFLGDDELDNPDDALSDLNDNMSNNNVISSLLLLPVSIYQSVVNNINGTCNSFNLGSLYNHNLTMTCIRPQDYIGSALWGVIDIIISGIFVLHIRKKFVDIFNHLTSLRTGGNELE